MSKIDDKFIAENDVIKRYLKDKLTPEETTEFEEYILDKPELLEQLELDAVLVENYATALDEVNKEESENNETSFMSTIRSLWSKPLIHSVASFAIGAVVVLLINGNNVDSRPYSGTIDLVELSPLRSSSAEDVPDATYSLSNKADTIILMIQPGFIDSQSAIVTITRRKDNTEIFKQKISVNSTEDLFVGIEKQRFSIGLYDVSINESLDSKTKLSLTLLIAD